MYCRAGHRPLRTSFSSHSPLSLSVLLSAPFYFNLPAKGGTWVWFWRALRQKGPLIAWELHFLPRFPSPYAPSNTGTSSGPLLSHLPTSSLPPSHGHLPTVCHLPPVFIPPSGRRALGRPGKGELWGVLTTMWLMETQQSGGKSCSMGTRNCRQPSQWHSSSIIPMRLKMRTTALARS